MRNTFEAKLEEYKSWTDHDVFDLVDMRKNNVNIFLLLDVGS